MRAQGIQAGDEGRAARSWSITLIVGVARRKPPETANPSRSSFSVFREEHLSDRLNCGSKHSSAQPCTQAAAHSHRTANMIRTKARDRSSSGSSRLRNRSPAAATTPAMMPPVADQCSLWCSNVPNFASAVNVRRHPDGMSSPAPAARLNQAEENRTNRNRQRTRGQLERISRRKRYVLLLAISVFTAILFGLIPAWRLVRTDMPSGLAPNIHGAGKSSGRSHTTKALIALQVAASLVLMVAAGLLVRSLENLRNFYPGFRTDHVLLFDVNARLLGYTVAQTNALNRNLIDQIDALPGIRRTSFSMDPPFSGGFGGTTPTIEGYQPASGGAPFIAGLNALGPHYFEALETPVLLGAILLAKMMPMRPKWRSSTSVWRTTYSVTRVR